MKSLIRKFLNFECEKHVQRHSEYLRELHEDIDRKERRIDASVSKSVLRPRYWELNSAFNPFKTRLARKLDVYAYTLAKKIRTGDYAPMRAVTHFVPKDDGSKRVLNVFQLPDAALSRLVYKSLLSKNANRFSAYAYAYRDDKGAHDAVTEIYTEWKNNDRIYVAEFDFTKFFDNIDHNYLWRVMHRQGFLCTPEERAILESFLCSESADFDSYSSAAIVGRTRGIPQGTSVSLFMANIACWELDRALERLGVGFSRYADDTLIWSESYAKVVQAYDVIRRHSDLMDVPINLKKSDGISLVTHGPEGEIGTKSSVNYLGYCVSLSAISIKDARVARIKKKLSFLIYQNLLQPLNSGIFNTKRLGPIDWDYLVALSQCRRYLYGGLTDEKLRKYLRGQITSLNFRGLMSYYPIVSNAKQLQTLDGWLIHTLKQALRRRDRLWNATHGIKLPGPKPNWIEDIEHLTIWISSAGTTFDFRMPSFSLINKAMQVAMLKKGISGVSHPKSVYYS